MMTSTMARMITVEKEEKSVKLKGRQGFTLNNLEIQFKYGCFAVYVCAACFLKFRHFLKIYTFVHFLSRY